MKYEQALEYLNSFINYESNIHQISPKAFSLDRVKGLLHQLGDPQKGLKIVHVAGTKGKGSVCAFVASVLKSQGYRTGLYTSPHINNVRERIRLLEVGRARSLPDDVFDDMISEEELAELITENRTILDAAKEDADLGKITFFEVLTALALVYFKKRNADFVVLETGLGGRLDATNAAESMVAAITPISLEHTHLLGDTLEKITREKMAIIKSRAQKVVLAPEESEVMKLLKTRCRGYGIKPTVVGEDISYEICEIAEKRQICTIKTKRAVYERLSLPLLGEHQAVNASLALGIIEQLIELGHDITKESIENGLKGTFWPLRFEILGSGRIILDGAHTVSSSKALVETIQKAYPNRRVTLIMGFTLEKDIQGMCKEFNRIADKVIATQSRHPRSFHFDENELRSRFPEKPCVSTGSIVEALKVAQSELGPEDILLISGSLYLVSEARTLCIN